MSDESTRVTNEAIERADKGANEEWKAAAYEAVRQAALKYGEIIIDQVHLFIPDTVSTPNKSALGPVMRRCARDGIIVDTGRTAPSLIPKKHRIKRPVWRVGPNA